LSLQKPGVWFPKLPVSSSSYGRLPTNPTRSPGISATRYRDTALVFCSYWLLVQVRLMAALAFSEFLQGHLSRLQQFNGHNNDLHIVNLWTNLSRKDTGKCPTPVSRLSQACPGVGIRWDRRCDGHVFLMDGVPASKARVCRLRNTIHEVEIYVHLHFSFCFILVDARAPTAAHSRGTNLKVFQCIHLWWCLLDSKVTGFRCLLDKNKEMEITWNLSSLSPIHFWWIGRESATLDPRILTACPTFQKWREKKNRKWE